MPEDVQILKDNWSLALMRNGIIVDLTVARWRGTTKLTPETLGIKFADDEVHSFTRKYINFGHQKLLPPDVTREFDSIDRRARDLLGVYSFNTVWGKFVPITAFEEWERQHEDLRAEYMTVAKQFGDSYNSIIATVKQEYAKLARDVWGRLHPDDKDGATDSFIESFSDKVVSKIPDRELIMSNFRFDAVYSFIPMPSFIERDIAAAQDIIRESQVKDFNANLQKQTERRIAEIYVKKKSELIEDFLESTIGTMRKYVSDLCDEVLISLGKHRHKNRVPDAQVKKLKRMMKRVRVLNFYDDAEINKHLNELEFEIDKFQSEMDKETVVRKLEEIVTISKKEFIHKEFSPAVDYLEV